MGNNGTGRSRHDRRAAMAEGRRWSVIAYRSRPSQSLEYALRAPVPPPSGHYTFTASDLEAYEVLSVAPAPEVLYLLKSGLRTAAATESILKARGVGWLLTDNSGLVTECVRRALPAEAVILWLADVASPLSPADRREEVRENAGLLPDALEAAATRAIIDRYGDGIAWDILNGRVRLSDLKTVGTKRAKGAALPAVISALRQIAAGESAFTAEQLRDLLTKANPTGTSANAPTAERAVRAAQAHGIEGLLAAEHLWQALAFLPSIAQAQGAASADGLRWVPWLDQFAELWEDEDMPQATVAMYTAGLTPTEAVHALINGLAPQQELALREDVPAPLSGGWL